MVNTSFVERDNLTQRQRNRHLTRRTNGFSKDLTWFEKQLWYRWPITIWCFHTRRPVTPAMAAGLTDHVWTTNELLSYRVSAAHPDQLRQSEHLFPSWHEFHHGS